MIALALAVIFLHSISIPIVVRVACSLDWDARDVSLVLYVAGFRILNKKKKLEAAELEQQERQEQQTEKRTIKFKPKRFLIDFAMAVLKRVRVRYMDMHAIIGTGDAAATAATVGGVRIFYSQLCALLCYDGSMRYIVPDYDSERMSGAFYGIFSLCLADIIFAALCAFFARRGKERSYANVVTE